MSGPQRRKRALELLHMKLNAAKRLQADVQGQIAALHMTGEASQQDIDLLGNEVTSLVALIAGRRWDLETPEAITWARVLQELSPRQAEGA